MAQLTKGYKWKDTTALMEYGLANYKYRNMISEGTRPFQDHSSGGIGRGIHMKAGNQVQAVVKGEKKEINVLFEDR